MSLPPFSGALRKLVIAFDVGTTYSGIGYAILDPGGIPRIRGVTRKMGTLRFPPSREGTVLSVGAEDEDLFFVEWFKLHLRPNALQNHEFKNSKLQPLPLGKTVSDFF